MAEINKSMAINEIISVDRGVIEILMDAGMHCVGCPSAQSETLEEAGFVHGQDVDALVDRINVFLANK